MSKWPRLLILILALASLATKLYLAHTTPLWFSGSDARSYHDVAMNVVNGTGATIGFYNNPGMNLFLTAIYGIFGANYLYGRYALILMSFILSFFIYRITKDTVDEKAALVALAISFFDPMILFYSTVEFGELVMFALVMAFFFLAIRNQQQQNKKSLLIMGALSGAASLFKSWLLILIPLHVGVTWLFRKGRSLKSSFIEGFLMTVTALILLSPWAVYNFQRSGHFVLNSTNGPINIFYGNNVYATTPLYNSSATPQMGKLIDPEGNLDDFEKNRRAMAYVYDFIGKNPGFVMKKCWVFLSKLWLIPNGFGHQRKIENYETLLTYWWIKWALGWLGFFALFKKIWRQHFMIWIFILITTAVYALSVYLSRYKDILLPFQIIYCAGGISLVLKWFNPFHHPQIKHGGNQNH